MRSRWMQQDLRQENGAEAAYAGTAYTEKDLSEMQPWGEENQITFREEA
jgi:hypothetical protein